MKSMGADRLLGPILQSVSRSFYLSIRFLPARLRRPVGLAYLLARATDTIADTADVPAKTRLLQLKSLASAIQRSPEGDVSTLPDSFAPRQTNVAENTLIESLPECFQILASLTADDRHDIRDVLAKINRAQVLDVERFGSGNGIRALSAADELNEYTYLIAGCVGEFWTRICDRHVANFAELPTEQMLELGRRYGEGLQLVNILRDVGSDLRVGRCYLPNDEVAAAGITPEQILEQRRQFIPIFRKWLAQAERGLKAGMEYSVAVRSRRIRGATVLPALIGARTVALLRDAGEAVLDQKVKVSRKEVQRILRKLAVGVASKRTVERIFAEVRGGGLRANSGLDRVSPHRL
jgi:farnesyl-diphosphate farnesyltransferase